MYTHVTLILANHKVIECIHWVCRQNANSQTTSEPQLGLYWNNGNNCRQFLHPQLWIPTPSTLLSTHSWRQLLPWWPRRPLGRQGLRKALSQSLPAPASPSQAFLENPKTGLKVESVAGLWRRNFTCWATPFPRSRAVQDPGCWPQLQAASSIF